MTGAAAPAAMRRPPIPPYVAEFTGVAILLAVGLSAVTIDFASGSPVPGWIPDPILRRLITGSVFAGTGTLVVYSVLGRISGGHLNPAMTLAFLRLGKMELPMAVRYVAAQAAGALVGAIGARLAWGALAADVRDGATVPGPSGAVAAFGAEALMTFGLVLLVLEVMRRPRFARYTPLAAGILVATLVTIEAPISGTSLNPARSLGPALVAGVYDSLWVYLAAPLVGALAAVAVAGLRLRPIPCAKLFHTDDFECHFIGCAYQRARRRPAGIGLDERPDLIRQEATR